MKLGPVLIADMRVNSGKCRALIGRIIRRALPPLKFRWGAHCLRRAVVGHRLQKTADVCGIFVTASRVRC